MSEKQEKIQKANEELERIQAMQEQVNLDISGLLSKAGDMPELGSLQLYDYDTDLIRSEKQAGAVIDSLAELYFGDNELLASNDYIKMRKKEDTKVLADTSFMQKVTLKNIITVQRLIDGGETTSRMFEVVNAQISTMRDNIKFAQNQKAEFERFYREIRKSMEEIVPKPEIEESKKDDPFVMSNEKLADMLRGLQ